MDYAQYGQGKKYFVSASTCTSDYSAIEKQVELLNLWSIPPNLPLQPTPRNAAIACEALSSGNELFHCMMSGAAELKTDNWLRWIFLL
jgi:hypothetical protein